ncbi:ABC transporter ATP-binding protein [Parafrankia sp. FMc2]|uniref:ABC transporter ATP-binding protein n=1 Tax=Parafrankia sp. FMc2 TaxID=3233196 RepID=UPI0034D7AD7F
MNPSFRSSSHRPLLDVLRRAGNRGLYAVTLIGAVAQYAGAVVAAAAGGWVVGAAGDGRSAADLRAGGLALLAGFVAAATGQWVNLHYAHAFAWRHQAGLRLGVYDGLERSTPHRLQGRRTGEVAAVTMADVELLEQFFAHLAPTAFAAALVSVASIVALATINPLVAIVFAGGVLTVAVLPALFARWADARAADLRASLGVLNADVVDGVRGMTELLLARRVDSWSDRVAASTRRYISLQRRQARAEGAQSAVTDLLVAATVILTLMIVVTAAAGTGSGGMTLATGALAVMLVAGALRPVVESTAIAASLAPLRASAHRVLALIEQPAVVADTAVVSPTAADSSVTFDGVAFGYEVDRPVLRDVTFTVRPGEMVALVGPSGAGKSTCANLLLRHWDVDAGSITIGGHDLRDHRLEDLRRLVGVVPQDVHLFDASVADNLRLGAPDATDDDLVAAARAASAHTFVAALPEGYATHVGENGARLSGGERQRLGIARALLRDTPILILDEAASNLDAENERALQAALRTVRHGRTTIVIAHRPATIRAADRVVVLREGTVVEQGPDADLPAGGVPAARHG